MEDRYLCKAKRTDNGGWVSGGLVRYGFTGREKYYIVPSYASDLYALEIDPSTICWCSGLRDKNGNLIWENDVVEFQFDEYCSFTNKDTKKRKGKVFFSDYRASFSIAMGRHGSESINNDLFRYVQCGNRVEVIGNKFDNPELVEV